MSDIRNYLDRSLNPWTQLGVAILVDIAGAISYMLPFFGEFGDFLFAPVQAMIVYWMVGKEDWGMFWVMISFGEEMLPWTDIVPSVTLAWLWKYWRW